MIVDGAETVPGGLLPYVSSPGPTNGCPLEWPGVVQSHRVMFARQRPARLTVTDRAAPGIPSPAGQELMLNYFQLQPYFEE